MPREGKAAEWSCEQRGNKGKLERSLGEISHSQLRTDCRERKGSTSIPKSTQHSRLDGEDLNFGWKIFREREPNTLDN